MPGDNVTEWVTVARGGLEQRVLRFVRGSRPLGTGVSVHLPPPLPQCLENSGTTPLKVLGVFRPPGSPASKTAAAEGGGDRGVR